MSTISDAAFQGDLAVVTSLLAASPNEIDKSGGGVDLTPLSAAISGGHLDVVKFLLSKKANPDALSPHNRTPLYFATTRAPPKDRAAIVQALIRANAKIDLVCDEDGNTPLMNAISQIRDKDVVHELVDNGASQSPQNTQNQTAKTLAEKYKMTRDLLPKVQRETSRADIVSLIVSFVLLIVSYVNSGFVKGVTQGIVKKLYKLTGSDSDSEAKQLLPPPQNPVTVDDFKRSINSVVKDSKFEKFFKPDDPFLQTLAANASALKEDSTTDLGNPENIGRLTRLSLYQPVIYCDDSGSMAGSRLQNMRELVNRIARIATRIVPDDMNGVDLRFINSGLELRLDAKGIAEAMEKVRADGGTRIGANLRKKILEPLVYKEIAKKSASNPIPWKRPLLVCIITDGEPSRDDTGVLESEIANCRQTLYNEGYEPSCVMFSISQIGGDAAATKFLNGLTGDTRIKDVIYVTTDQLDSKLQELRANERGLESWLLHLLTRPIMEGGDQ